MPKLHGPALLLGLICACGAPEAIQGNTISTDFAGGLYEAPFPSDHRLENGLEDGQVDVLDFPNPRGVEFVARMRQILRRDAHGFGTSSGIFFQLSAPLDRALLLEPAQSVEASAPIFLVAVEAPQRRHPFEARFHENGGPHGAPNLLSLIPVQGAPLAPGALHAAVVLRRLAEPPLGVSLSVRQLIAGDRPEGLSEMAFERYRTALKALEQDGLDLDEIAGLAVFSTDDPIAPLSRFREALLDEPRPQLLSAWQQTERHEGYCVFESALMMPVYQSGAPPFETEGGGFAEDEAGAPLLQTEERARVVVTLPRRPMPEGGFPAVVFIRTGGGGDRPLVDRGVRAEPGGPAVTPGSGPAQEFAEVGFAGVSIDGPHGGLRNITGGDEQFLIFNIFNPLAMRDNIRQSALELMLLAHLLPDWRLPAEGCEGLGAQAQLSEEQLVLMGHSMGATIAPLTLALEPRYKALILSGAGGSWINNIVHKRSPLEVKPLAELVLDYDDQDYSLHEHDPVLSLLQWAGEPADPPVYAITARDRHVLMLQGIVDTYILPPIANATSLSFGLQLAGEPLEPSLPALLPLFDLQQRSLPAGPAGSGRTGIVIQHPEGPVEDGHEVVFQTEAPKRQYRCFLESLLEGAPEVCP